MPLRAGRRRLSAPGILHLLDREAGESRQRIQHVYLPIAGHYLPAVRDAHLRDSLHVRRRIDRLGVVLGLPGGIARRRALDRRRQPAGPDHRDAISLMTRTPIVVSSYRGDARPSARWDGGRPATGTSVTERTTQRTT